MTAAFLPSPSDGVWHLGPLPLRAYAMCIVAGVLVAVWLTERRWRARGGRPGMATEVATWAVPFGVVGGRLYHVLTTPEPYFGVEGKPVSAFYVWEGGLGIWGAIALGGVGAWIGCRRAGVPLAAFADAAAPGIALAQAVGRFGNWFNQELFGRPTTVPWALEIDPEHRPAGYENDATFHPTFGYEALWDVGLAGLVIWLDRRLRLGHGRAFAVYVAGYTVGRLWIEALRIDPANTVLGLRLNIWTCLVVLTGAVANLVLSWRARPGRETPEQLGGEAAMKPGGEAAMSSAGAASGEPPADEGAEKPTAAPDDDRSPTPPRH